MNGCGAVACELFQKKKWARLTVFRAVDFIEVIRSIYVLDKLLSRYLFTVDAFDKVC